MKKLLMAVIAAAALSLPVTVSYAAAPTGNIVVAENDRHHGGVYYRHRGHQNWNRGHRGYQNWNRDNRQPDAWRNRYPTGFVAHPRWSRGDRLYRTYWAPQYYVTDYRVYHLRRPPYGYRWVRVNDDYLLVAIGSGIILDVVMHD